MRRAVFVTRDLIGRVPGAPGLLSRKCAQDVSALDSRVRGNDARRGLSLLEVLISVAIFLGSLTAIMQVLNVGQRAEVNTRLNTEAVLRCESKMAEFVAGVEEAVSSQGNVFDDDESGDWKWTADVADSGTTGLLMVTVRVEHSTGGDDSNADFALSRFMRDPQLFVDAALSETAE